jgi:hypothetical protein
MKKSAAALTAILASSAALFFTHKFAADRLPQWLGEQMVGVEIKRLPYGSEVVIPATLTTVEYGIALFLLYLALRRSLPAASAFSRSLALAALSLALGGNLVRMPMMQLVVGNPLHVVLVQHGAVWLPYIVGSLMLTYCYEWLHPIQRARPAASAA